MIPTEPADLNRPAQVGDTVSARAPHTCGRLSRALSSAAFPAIVLGVVSLLLTAAMLRPPLSLGLSLLVIVLLAAALLHQFGAQRRQTAQQIVQARRERAWLRLLDEAGLWTWSTDAQGRLIEVSRAAFAPEILNPMNTVGRVLSQTPGLDADYGDCHRITEHLAQHQAVRGRLRLRRGGSTPLYLELTALPLPHADGSFSGHIGVCRDVGDQIDLAQALADRDDQHRQLNDHLREVVFRIDTRGRWRSLNQAWQTLSGIPVAQALGKRCLSWLNHDERRYLLAQLEPLLAGKRSNVLLELRLRRPAQEDLWVELSMCASHAENGAVEGLYGSLSDITERKRAEAALYDINEELERRVRLRTAELEASNRELEAFSYSVSHDLRAPLRAIDGFSQIIREDYGQVLDEQAHGHLQRIRAASQRLSSLIDDLLELGRITRTPLQRTEVDLSLLARNILRDLQAREPLRKVSVDIGAHLMARTDTALAQVLLNNLLSNAWKFTARTDDARIEFDARMRSREVVFHVKDNGAGFDMAHSNKLFRPFQRLHGHENFGGSGIGLATVQRIVQRHGGRIWAEGRPGHGACFYFTLPDSTR